LRHGCGINVKHACHDALQAAAEHMRTHRRGRQSSGKEKPDKRPGGRARNVRHL
jgi:hypothetical protein